MLGRIAYLARTSRQIPGAALKRQIPGAAVLPRMNKIEARAFSTSTSAMDLLKDRLVEPATAADKLKEATLKAEAGFTPVARIDETQFRRVPSTSEEQKFVDSCFNLFDLNGNGVIETWEVNAVYESGSGPAVGACFIEAGLAGCARNSGLTRTKSVGNLERSISSYGIDFTENAQVLKAMDLVRAIKKGRVNVSGDQQFDRYITKDEFTRWAMRLVELHNASQLEMSSFIDEARPDVVTFANEAVAM